MILVILHENAQIIKVFQVLSSEPFVFLYAAYTFSCFSSQQSIANACLMECFIFWTHEHAYSGIYISWWSSCVLFLFVFFGGGVTGKRLYVLDIEIMSHGMIHILNSWTFTFHVGLLVVFCFLKGGRPWSGYWNDKLAMIEDWLYSYRHDLSSLNKNL